MTVMVRFGGGGGVADVEEKGVELMGKDLPEWCGPISGKNVCCVTERGPDAKTAINAVS
ncbi:hypothetical protein [Aphanothece microscopica]|uniref:hypothetical protein n=1 Tax=Aphanothece microscopica TaxID=1049561 RepID=UPI003985296B